MHKDCSIFFHFLVPALRFSHSESGHSERIGNERSFRRLIDVRCGLVVVGLCGFRLVMIASTKGFVLRKERVASAFEALEILMAEFVMCVFRFGIVAGCFVRFFVLK